MFRRAHIFEQFLSSVGRSFPAGERIELACVFAAFQRALFNYQSRRYAMGDQALTRAIGLKSGLQPALKAAIEAISEHPVSAYGYYTRGKYDAATQEICQSLEMLDHVGAEDKVGVSLAQLEQELNLVRIGFRRGSTDEARAHLGQLLAVLRSPGHRTTGLRGDYGPLQALGVSERAALADYLIAAAPGHLRLGLDADTSLDRLPAGAV